MMSCTKTPKEKAEYTSGKQHLFQHTCPDWKTCCERFEMNLRQYRQQHNAEFTFFKFQNKTAC